MGIVALAPRRSADVAQLVERNLAKVEVASSNLVVRSSKKAPAIATGAFLVSALSSRPSREALVRLHVLGAGRVHDLLRQGGGGSSPLRSQPDSAEVSQSRTNCLSKEGWARPGSHWSAGQKREESGVSTSSATPSVSPSKPNSNFVSARMIPRSRAMSRPRP